MDFEFRALCLPNMPSVCFYFQVHQPYRLKQYRLFDVGHDRDYFNDTSASDLNNERVLRKVADKCYLPANRTLLRLLREHPEFKVSFSISGMALEQFEEYAPEVLDSFRALVDTGRVELLTETYYHSLAFLFSPREFRRQVVKHDRRIRELFGVQPRVFRNTELMYNNEVAAEAERLGYETVLAEGADQVLGWRTPNFVYRPPNTRRIRLLLKNYRLSDDVAFRFSTPEWSERPLTADKFADWISALNGNGEVVNLFMDYETFGEHQWEETGIFEFLSHLPSEILRRQDNGFVTPSEAAEKYEARGTVDVPHVTSWADVERDISAWRSNPMQEEALGKLYALEPHILGTGDAELREDWRRMQTSDHMYYMGTKWFADGDVHAYFNPYESPYEAFIAYMNALQDIRLRTQQSVMK